MKRWTTDRKSGLQACADPLTDVADYSGAGHATDRNALVDPTSVIPGIAHTRIETYKGRLAQGR